MRVCAECLEEIQVLSRGDEAWDYCESCELTEGKTVELEEVDHE